MSGHVPSFNECFLGEGNVDPAAAMRVLLDANFDGFVMDDHVPVMEGDDEETLSARILEQEHKLYPEAVRLFCEGRIKVDGRRVSIT